MWHNHKSGKTPNIILLCASNLRLYFKTVEHDIFRFMTWSSSYIFVPGVSPVERGRFLMRSSWDSSALLGSRSCPSSLRRSDVRRRGSKQSRRLPALRQRRPDGRRKEAGAGDGAPCWEAPTLQSEINCKDFGKTCTFLSILPIKTVQIKNI